MSILEINGADSHITGFETLAGEDDIIEDDHREMLGTEYIYI